MINWIASKFKTFALQRTYEQNQKTSYKLEENFANYISDKEQILICKTFLKLTVKNNPLTK